MSVNPIVKKFEMSEAELERQLQEVLGTSTQAQLDDKYDQSVKEFEVDKILKGTIVKVHVAAGAAVNEGDPICVLEAMKMENEVRSPSTGEVVDLRVQPGDTVTPGQVIAMVK